MDIRTFCNSLFVTDPGRLATSYDRGTLIGLCLYVYVCECACACVCVFVCVRERGRGGGFVALRGTERECVPQHIATHCTHTATHYNNTLQYAAPHSNTLQHTVTHCNTLQHSSTHRELRCKGLSANALLNTPQHAAHTLETHCNNTLQHTATHCNTP